MRSLPEPNLATAPWASSPARGLPLGWWEGPREVLDRAERGPREALGALELLEEPVFAVGTPIGARFVNAGHARIGTDEHTRGPRDALPLLGFAPPLPPEQLGDSGFAHAHGARYPYMTGSMANGIASTDLVTAATRAGLVSSYGAAGQTVSVVAAALDRLDRALGHGAYCVNLIHSPSEPAVERELVELLLARGVRRVEASAYVALTAPVVRYRLHGATRDRTGRARAGNAIIAKASRVEVASRWLSPPPPKLVTQLLAAGELSRAEAELAPEIVMADDLTAEADSGGHTDNQPAITLLPTFIALRDRLQPELPESERTRVGAAGGIATPAGLAAALTLGAAYVVTGTVNQSCREAGTSDRVRAMLAAAEQADVAMAPAADMFELGVKLQVLKRGTLFAMRAGKLLEAYRAYPSLEALPAELRTSLERDLFRAPLDDIWDTTRAYFRRRDPALVARAEGDPRQRMALVFRWYLGLSSRWANEGDPERQADYQIWCGPAMGAFNEWTRGTPLADSAERTVARIADVLLRGAAVVLRAQALVRCGVSVPGDALNPRPRPSVPPSPRPV